MEFNIRTKNGLSNYSKFSFLKNFVFYYIKFSFLKNFVFYFPVHIF